MKEAPRSREFLRWGAAVLLAASAAGGQSAERKFFSGYAGKIPPRESDRSRTYFEKPAVRALLARLESGSATAAEAEPILRGSGASVEDLRRVGLLRVDGEALALGFAYFTADDMRKVHALADRAAIDLAAAFRARRREFAALTDAYPPRGVRRDELAFVLLAGFSLNWDGLALTQERSGFG